MEHILFIYPLIDIDLGCFHLLAIVSNAARNRGIQISVLGPAFNSFWYMSRSRIIGLNGNSV